MSIPSQQKQYHPVSQVGQPTSEHIIQKLGLKENGSFYDKFVTHCMDRYGNFATNAHLFENTAQLELNNYTFSESNINTMKRIKLKDISYANTQGSSTFNIEAPPAASLTFSNNEPQSSYMFKGDVLRKELDTLKSKYNIIYSPKLPYDTF